MTNQFFASGVTAIKVVVAVVLLVFLLCIPPRFVFMRVSPPAGASVKKVRVYVKNMIWPGKRPPAIGSFYFFVIAGGGRVFVSGAGCEDAEIDISSTGEVFQGDISHHSLATIFHTVGVQLIPKLKNLKIVQYNGRLDVGGDGDMVLAIHKELSSYRSMPLKLVQRQWYNKGHDPTMLPYLRLSLQAGDDMERGRFNLDFSHVDGGVQEYLPLLGWPRGDRVIRVLYALNGEAPRGGYQQILTLPATPEETPYGLGRTYFYGIIGGHYCAGYIQQPALDLRQMDKAHAYITLWLNAKKGDRRLRQIR